MGKHFGELAKVRGVVQYRLSPFEQRAFAGAISHGLPNLVRRFWGQVFIVGTPLLLGYLVYDSVEKEHKRMMRKNPADYANDK